MLIYKKEKKDSKFKMILYLDDSNKKLFDYASKWERNRFINNAIKKYLQEVEIDRKKQQLENMIKNIKPIKSEELVEESIKKMRIKRENSLFKS